MTTYRMYRCNVCQDYIQPTDSTSKEGFGLHWNGKGYEFKRPHECERHICHGCARNVHDELRKVTPAQNANLSNQERQGMTISGGDAMAAVLGGLMQEQRANRTGPVPHA